VAPAPALGGFSVSRGPRVGRRVSDAPALARPVTVEADEVDRDARELRLLVESHRPHASVQRPSGEGSAAPESVRREHVRLRFWESGDGAIRAGYLVDETAPTALRTAFDRLTDSGRRA
jgi:hypothetical protein